MGKVHIAARIKTQYQRSNIIMGTYTESQLDKLEEAAKAADRKARPREIEAGRKYLLTPESERSYANTATKLFKSDGTNPQEGRTGVYVRTYLEFIDKLEEAPSRGRRSNGSGAVTFKQTGNIVLDANLAQREQMLAMQDDYVTRVNTANEAVDTFDADEYKTLVMDEFRAEIADLQRKLTAWETDEKPEDASEDTLGVASQSAADTLADLTKVRDETNAASGDALANISKQIDLSNQMLTMLVTVDEDAAKALKDAHEDLFKELTGDTADAPA